MKRTTAGLSPKTNRALVIAESMLTAGIISVPFMTILYEAEIGLTHEQIAITQAAFTVVAMLLNIPLGWVADRFSRKFANILGDFLCFLGLIFYTQAHTMLDCVLCETLFGVGIAFSQGVDSSLLKHFADKEDASNNHKLYKDSFGRMSSLCYLVCLAYYVIGFAIGDMNVRDIIMISSIPFIFAIIAGLFIHDDSVKLGKTKAEAKEEAQENKKSDDDKTIFEIIHETLGNPKLNIRIAAYMIAREMTHGIIWCFTPLLQFVGIDGKWIVLGWAANSLAAYLGTKLARRLGGKLSEWVRFVIPVMIVALAALAMSIHLSVFTLCLYVFFGIAQGWTSVTMMPQIKIHTKGKLQVTVESIAKVCSQLYYIVAVWLIGRAADIKLEYAALATILLFVPLAIPVAIRLKRQTESEKVKKISSVTA